MGVYISANKVFLAEMKPFHFQFDLPKNFNKNITYEVDLIISHHRLLTEQKTRLIIYCTNIRLETNDIHEYRKQKKQ